MTYLFSAMVKKFAQSSTIPNVTKLENKKLESMSFENAWFNKSE